MATDRWGCPITAKADDVAVVDAAITDYVTMALTLETRLGPLAEGGPLSRAILAMLLAQSHRPALMARARDLSDEASEQAGGLSAREQAHVDAARAWSRGDLTATVAAFDRALADHPTDMLALRARYLLQFSTGRIDDMMAGVRAARPHWGSDLPLASYLDGMESFALEEAGHYRPAEILGRQGVERDEGDLWAIHAVAHVLEMEDRRPEGVEWIGSMPILSGRAGFAGHLWWHQALALLALGRHHDVLDSLDRRIYPGASEEGLDLTNAISLLARLEMAGLDVGPRWERLAAPAAARLGQHSHPFNDTHYALALSRAGREHRHQSQALLEGLAAWSRRPDEHSAQVLAVVGLATARALDAFGQGRWSATVEHLAPVAGELWRLGGSHAQRQLYTQVLATAQLRAQAEPGTQAKGRTAS